MRLGDLISKLTLDPSQYIGGLDKAESKLKSFAAVAARSAQNFASGNSAGIFTDPLQAGLSALPGGGVAAAGVGIASQFARSIDQAGTGIANTSKQADKLGLSYNTMLALQSAAGDSADALSGAMGHLAKEVFAAARGSSEAQNKFSELGVDWKRLAGASPEQQIRLLADRISSSTSPTEKLAIEMGLLGRRGVELDNVFKDGAKGIDVWKSRIEESGRALSDQEARMVRLAKLERKLAEEELTGIKEQLSNNKNRFDLAIAEELKGTVFEKASKLAPTLIGLFGRPSQASFDAVDKRLAAKANEKDRAVDPQVLLRNSINEATDALQKQIDMFGLNADARKRAELVAQGADDSELKRFDDKLAKLTQIEARKRNTDKLNEDTRRTRAEVEDPLSKADVAYRRINELHKLGKINADEQALAVGNLAKQFLNLGNSAKLPSALIEGSAAAFSAIARHESSGNSGDVGQQIKAGIEVQKEIQKRQLVVAEQIRDALKDNGFKQAR